MKNETKIWPDFENLMGVQKNSTSSTLKMFAMNIGQNIREPGAWVAIG